MCGVLFARRRDKHPVKKALLKRYNKQSGRGKKGYGFIGIEDGYVKDIQRFETESDAERAVKNCESSEILFHHRMPTSTPNYKDMTHPIVVQNKELEHDYYVIHNGVLRNENTLKTKHEGLGYDYTTLLEETTTVKTRNGKKETTIESFNDSEALAIEVARYLDGKSDTIEAVGTIAFICFQTDKNGKVKAIHYGRNSGNPLVIENNGDLFFIKSEGHGETVPADVLHTIDYKTGKETTKSIAIGKLQFQSYPQAPYQQSRIGYGEPQRALSPVNGSVRSPIQNRGGVLDWGSDGGFSDDDLPFGDLPTIQFDSDVRRYQNSEEYLLDLEAEIVSLEHDIGQCKMQLERPHLTEEDISYYEEYMDECNGVLSEKRREHRELEDRLAGMGM